MRGLKYIFILIATFASSAAFAQADRQYIRNGNKLFHQQNYAKAEVEYRKAISKNPNNSQYTQNQMKRRAARMWPKIKIKKGIDILLTHSPAFGIGDGEDNPHKGFEAFVDILDKYKPKYFIHGHVHLNYSVENKREREYKDTIIINGYDRYVFEYPDKYILKGSGSDS